MNPQDTQPTLVASLHDQWRDLVARYQTPSTVRSTWQLVNTVVPFVALWAIMYWSLGVSYWITLALALPAGGLLVRIFIISHDCGHGAFFRSRRANTLVGAFTGLLCCAPYYHWKHEHALHHAGFGNLDKRGHGDIWTMTVQEYLASPRRTRLAYRFYRNPLVLFAVGSLYVFVIDYRFTPKNGSEKDRKSVHRTNLALAVLAGVMIWAVGLPALLMIHLPILFVAASAGAWLFYVQHQFEDVYWARKGEWNYLESALMGSSYYRLPKVLQWFTGNIGFHHIHHLSSKIPNYYLEKCHRENEVFQQAPTLTLWSSLRCITYRLVDEERGRLVSFREIRHLPRVA